MLSMGRIPHEEARHSITVHATAANGIAVRFSED